jgi:hypothetical protein
MEGCIYYKIEDFHIIIISISYLFEMILKKNDYSYIFIKNLKFYFVCTNYDEEQEIE